jgi:hypothetical protein
LLFFAISEAEETVQELKEVAVEEDDDAKLQRFLLQVDADSQAAGARSLPTKVVVLRHVFDPTDTTTDMGAVEADIGAECSNAGPIVSLQLDVADGAVTIEYANIESAERCVEVMHGRWFDERQLAAEYQRGGSEVAQSGGGQQQVEVCAEEVSGMLGVCAAQPPLLPPQQHQQEEEEQQQQQQQQQQEEQLIRETADYELPRPAFGC